METILERCAGDGFIISFTVTDPSFALPEGVTLTEDAGGYALTYAPREVPTAEVIAAVLAAGALREMTLKEQNVDALIARMYREVAR